MKRKLPKLDGALYLGPSQAQQHMMNTGEYHLWATATDSPTVIRLVRKATHEVPNSKWVEFAVVPEALLLNRVPLYVSPSYAGMAVRCEWSDFLRLTRWRKTVQDLPPTDQAKIARLEPAPDAANTLRLVAVDDPIRRQRSVG